MTHYPLLAGTDEHMAGLLRWTLGGGHPPFCVLAYGDLEVPAFGVMNERGSPNAWGRPILNTQEAQ